VHRPQTLPSTSYFLAVRDQQFSRQGHDSVEVLNFKMSKSSGYQSLDTTERGGITMSTHASESIKESEKPNNVYPFAVERSGKANFGVSSITGANVRGHGSIWTVLSVPALVLIAFAIFLLMIIIGFASYKYSEASGCLGPPYLYVSTSNEHNIMQITRDGCLTMNTVLFGVPRGKMEMRSMILGPYNGATSLYVADARPETSQVLVFGDCSYWTGLRSFQTSLFTQDGPFGDGAQHAYGITIDNAGNTYASFQHTNVVLRASAPNFQPYPAVSTRSLKSKPSINDSSAGSNLGPYIGTFYQFGNATQQNPQDQGVRGISWVETKSGGRLWINNEFDNTVYIVDSRGNQVKKLDIKLPLGIFHNPNSDNFAERQLVYVGSRGKKASAVYAIDKNTYKIVKTFRLIGMTHPTGIAVHDVLYVADQGLGAILTFDLNTTSFIKNIWERHVGGDLEHILLTPC
jgi:hypothetical protein